MTNEIQSNDHAASPTNCEAVRSGDWLGDSNEEKTPDPEKWAVVVVMGKDWGDMMRGLRDQATQLYIDAERSGAPSTWGISGRYAYWSGVGGRPSLDEIARVVESAKSPSDPKLSDRL